MVAAIRLAGLGREGFSLETASVRLCIRPRLPLQERIRDDRQRSLRPVYVTLISTVHLADKEYFAALQRECEPFDRVLFELIADESATIVEGGVRKLKAPMSATPQLRQLSASYGLVPQVDALDCTRPNWALADVSRSELLQREADVGAGSSSAFRTALRTLRRGPASRSGGGLIRTARRRLAWSLPAPELALLLDDWTTSGGAPPAQVLSSLVSAVASLDLFTAKRLSFAQTLATGEATQLGTPAAQLVRWRNSRALDELEAAVKAGCSEVALLYGALHMRDMRSQMQRRFEIVEVCEPKWRTAWRLPTARAAPIALPVAVLVLLVLLVIDGTDWVETTRQLLDGAILLPSFVHLSMNEDSVSAELVVPSAEAVQHVADAAAAAVLYAIRHSVLYLAISRWAFEWDRRWYNEAGDT